MKLHYGTDLGFRVSGTGLRGLLVVGCLLPLFTVPAQAQDGPLSIGVGIGRSSRSATLGGVAQNTNGTGPEVAARFAASFAEARFEWRPSRSLSQTSDADLDIERFGADLALGSDLVRLVAGFTRRSLSGGFGSRRWSYGRLGAEVTLPLGIPNMDLSLATTRYLMVTADRDASEPEVSGPDGWGREAEIRLELDVSGRWHWYGAYRYDEFTAKVSDLVGGNRPERTSSLVVGIAVGVFGGG